jgi:hypothetical protein
MKTLVERHSKEVVGTISCFDRVVITGTLPDMAHRSAAERFLATAEIPLGDFASCFKKLRDDIAHNANNLAEASGLSVQYVDRKNFRKEERIKEILVERGDAPGLVHVFSAMEPCQTYRVQGSKFTNGKYLASRYGKCLHYYFYFIDSDLGLCYCRVETWTPFRLQFYFNGHNWLASQLKQQRVGFTLQENAFTDIEDFDLAQRLADRFSPKWLHRKLDKYAQQFCPVIDMFPSSYRWSIMQIEYSTDIIFTSADALKPLYDHIVRTAIHSVEIDNIATFFGRTFDGRCKKEIVTDFNNRVKGTRIKHSTRDAAIKMYDKHGRVLRIEATANKVSSLRHHRMVEHRDGTKEMKIASVRRTIYSLNDVAGLLSAANSRYLDFISSLDDPSEGYRHLEKVVEPVHVDERCYRGFNLFEKNDLELCLAIVRGEFNISGMRNRDLRFQIKKSGAQCSRLLKRLLLHGLIKKVHRTYKYYLTKLGRSVISCALQLRKNIAIPALANAIST